MSSILDAIFPLSPQFFVGVITAVVVIHVVLASVGLFVYFERKVSAYIQDRIGPNRVGFDLGLPFLQKLFRGFGFWGLGQSLADGLKFILKEDYRPPQADKVLFSLAPMLSVVPALIGWAVIPWGGVIEINPIVIGGREIVSAGDAIVGAAAVDIGFIFILAVASMSVYGVTLGGWASNNKYSFLGGMRASAGMISYEIPMGLCLLVIVLTAGTVGPHSILESQTNGGLWYIFVHPLAAILFYTCTLAEGNRSPFDNAESEQELVGGWHTEYSSMRFALFFLAEFAHLVTGSAFFVLLFMGGYHMPFVPALQPEATGLLAAILKFSVFFGKVVLMVIFAMLVRWTIPRLRYDQMMKLCWNAMIPLSIALMVSVATVRFLQIESIPVYILVNIAITALGMALFPKLPAANVNKRIPLAGSRFSPIPGHSVQTAPTSSIARSDAPVPQNSSGVIGVH
ncbi:MAG: NADH-quinone oxidoreductase subunit H [Phycisphaerales bacterium JB050]